MQASALTSSKATLVLAGVFDSTKHSGATPIGSAGRAPYDFSFLFAGTWTITTGKPNHSKHSSIMNMGYSHREHRKQAGKRRHQSRKYCCTCLGHRLKQAGKDDSSRKGILLPARVINQTSKQNTTVVAKVFSPYLSLRLNQALGGYSHRERWSRTL